MKKIMPKYLELQTNIQLLNTEIINLYKGDILIANTNFFTKEDSIIEAIYNNYNVVDVVKITCNESTKFIIDKYNFQNDSTLLYMLINMSMVIEITTQYNRNRLIDDVLSI